MRKALIALLLIATTFGVRSQHVQLHYDFGEGRNYLTSTIEMFKPDDWGYTFFFVDMDYGVTDNLNGMNLAYLEVARSISLGENSPWGAHLEYNGGLFQINNEVTINIENAWLTGIEYSYNNEDFTRGFTFQTLYKHIAEKHDFSFQLTGVWYAHYLDNKLSFMGYADFWREDFDRDNDGNETRFVFQAEPQLWYNFNEHYSVGSEIELSKNFISEDFEIMPTVGVKWQF